MEASITVKIKGVTKSQLQDRAKRDEGNFISSGNVIESLLVLPQYQMHMKKVSFMISFRNNDLHLNGFLNTYIYSN